MADLSNELPAYQVPPGGIKTFTPSSPDELLNTPMPASLMPKESATGLSKEPVSQWGEGADNFKKAILEPLTMGASSNSAAIQGLNSWGNPDLTPEQMAAEVENDAVIQAQMHRDDFNNTHEYTRIMTLGEGATAKGFYAADLGGAVIEAIPQMAPILAAGAYGATMGAMTGTLPGIMIGGLGGMAVGAFAMVGGHHTYDMMQRGVKRENAIAGGIIMGSIGAGTQLVGGALLGKVVPEMATTLMRAGSFRAAIAPISRRLLVTAGINTSLGQVQSVVDSYAKYIETTATGNAPGTKPLTMKEAQDNFMVSLITGAATNVAAEAALTPLALHAGLNSIKTHAERLTAEYNFQQREIAEAHLKAQAEAKAEQQRTTEVTGRVVEKQAESNRKIGYFDVSAKNTNIAKATADLEAAKQAAKAAPPTLRESAKLDVAQAEAVLDQVTHEAYAEALEDALTDPKLVENMEKRKRQLDMQVTFYEDELDRAQTPAEEAIWKAKIRQAKKQISDINAYQKLGNEDQIKAGIRAAQYKLRKQARQAQAKTATITIRKRMEARAEQIVKVKVKAALKEAQPLSPEETIERQNIISNLELQQDIDQITFDALVTDTFTDSGLLDLQPQIPTKRLLGLVGTAQSMIAKAAKSGATNTRQLIGAAKKLLKRVVNTARISDEAKTDLVAKIDVLTFKDAQATFDEIRTALEDAFKAEKLKAAISELKRVLPEDTGAREPSKFPGVAELIGAIRGAVKDFGRVGSRQKELAGRAKLTDWEDAELDIYQNLFPKPVKSMTADQVTKIIDTIHELETEGKAQATKRIDDRRARAAEKGDVLDEHMMTPNKRANMSAIERRLDAILDEGPQSSISDWRGLMTILTKLGKVSDMANILDPKSAGSAAELMRKFWEARFQTLREAAGITDILWQKMQVDFSKQAPFLEYKRGTMHTAAIKKGILGTLQRASLWRPKMTHAELIQIHAWLLDKEASAVARLNDGNGYTRTGEVEAGMSTQEVIEHYLDAEMPGWRDYEKAMLEFYQEFEPVVDEASFNRSGKHIERNETYGGKLLQNDDGGNPRETHRRASGRAGTTLQRADKVSEIEVIDAHRNLISHINEVTHDITHLEFEQDALAIFSDPARRKWIKSHIGERTLTLIDEHINDIILGYNRNQKTVDVIAAWLRENMFGHFLLGKPEQAVKQMTGAIICLESIGPDAAIRGWEYMLANPAETEKLMAESGIWQARAEKRDPDYHPSRSHKRFAQTIGGHALEVGDKYGAAAAAFPIYLEELRTSGNKALALKKFETAIATQSSGRIEDLPAIFRGNAWTKLASVMAQEPTQAVQRISIAWRKYRASGSLSDLRQYWRVVAVTHLASLMYQLAGYAYWYPFYTDEERAKKLAFIAATFSPYTGLPMAGQFLGYAMAGVYRYVLGVDISKIEPDIFPSFGAEFVRFFDTFMKEGTGVEELDLLKLLQEASDLAGVTHGLPVGNYVKETTRVGRALSGSN